MRASDDPKVSDDLKVYAAGFLEGFASARQVRDFQHNANGLMAKDEASHQAPGQRILLSSSVQPSRPHPAGSRFLLRTAYFPTPLASCRGPGPKG